MASTRNILLSIFGISVLVHGWLVVNEGVYADEWVYWPLMLRGDWAQFHEILKELGQGFLYYFYDPIYHMDDPFRVMRLLIMISLAAISCFIFLIFRDQLNMSPFHAWSVAVLSLIYPIYNILIHVSCVHYLIPMAFFFGGWWLYFNWKPHSVLIRACVVYPMLGLACYVYNSLFTVYFGFILVLWFIEVERQLPTWGERKNKFPAFLKRYAILIVFPFAMFFLKRMLTETYGQHAGYNQLVFEKKQFWDAVSLVGYVFVKNFFQTIKEILRLIRTMLFPVFWVLPFSLLFSVLYGIKKEKLKINRNVESLPLHPFLWIAAGAFVILSILPYAMVGKYVYPANGMRHAFLQGFPMAFLFVLAVIQIQQKWLKSVPWVSTVFLSFAILLGSLATIYKHNEWQLRWVMDRAMMETLKTIEPLDPGMTLFLDTPFYDGRDIYRVYEITGVLNFAWSGNQWVAVHDRDFSEERIHHHLNRLREFTPQQKNRYNFENYNPSGCAVRMVVTGHPETTINGFLTLKYWYYKWFASDQFVDFLKRVLVIRLEPLLKGECIFRKGPQAVTG